MSVTWNLTDVELTVLWERLFRDQLPQPLFALHRGTDLDEWSALAAAAWDRWQARDDGALHDALGRIAHADVRVTAWAIDPRDPADPTAIVRAVGARQGQVATLIRQLPGETFWHSGGFVVTMGAADRLPGAMVGTLPPAEAGRAAPARAAGSRSSGIELRHLRSLTDSGDPDAPRWPAGTAELTGMIETSLGRSIFGPRGIAPHRIEWCDLEADGRYAAAGHTPVTGTGQHQLAALITTDIGKALQTLEDERYG